MSLAGVVGAGKTGMAELLAQELGIDIMRELDGSNDEIKGELLGKFLADKATYCFDLQKYLTPKRTDARKEKYAQRRSFVEDRTPEEDQLVFHRRFHEQGYLTDAQVEELHDLAQRTYAKGPKSDCMVMLMRNPREARKMILARGRPVEVRAWPESELRAMARFYEESGSGAMIKDLAKRLKDGIQISDENAVTDLEQRVLVAEQKLERILQVLDDVANRGYPLKGRDFREDVFFDLVDALGAHDGAKVRLDMDEIDPKNTIHRGFMYQEMFHGMLEHERVKRARGPA